MGSVVNKHITSNPAVNNAILGFAVLGCVKISLWFCWIVYNDVREGNPNDTCQIERCLVTDAHQTSIDVTDFKSRRETVNITRWKYKIVVFTFYFEDGPELILENP